MKSEIFSASVPPNASHQYAGLAHAVVALLTMLLLIGCKSADPTGLPEPLPDRDARMQNGYLYYLDGAGGGTAKKNWAGGVKDGLLAAGYPGAGEMYSWEKGKGLLTDQDASVQYKRLKASGLAIKIQSHAIQFPGTPIGILGFSAGCAEAVFALEALPENIKVDDVVLLGASISEDYDLTEALKRVRNKLYIYTSTEDQMLGFWMKLSGTADRRFHDPGAGIDGFVLPKNASAATRKAYSQKIVTIPWTEAMEIDGNSGHHFDNVKMEFIRDHVAPLFMGNASALLDGSDAPAAAAASGQPPSSNLPSEPQSSADPPPAPSNSPERQNLSVPAILSPPAL